MSAKGRDELSAAATARQWANDLVRRESRGPGDMESAMRRLEARYGIPWRTFWTLRYRTPADVMVGVFLKLQAAHHAECERQQRLLKHEIDIAQAKVSAFQAVARPQPDLAGSESDAGAE